MNNYFSRPLWFGRYKGMAIGEAYARDRQYFDQILYKNQKFRHEYATFYEEWLKNALMETGDRPEGLLLARINASIDIVGEDETQKLFLKVLDITGHQDKKNLRFRETLPGGPFALAPENAELMKVLARFWQRFALPEVREE